MKYLIVATLLLFSPSVFASVGIGFQQTFGTNNYTGSRLPLSLFKTPLSDTDNKWFELGLGVDTFSDDLVAARYYAVEPKLRIFAESEASLQASYRGVIPTDGFSMYDFGIELRYSALQPPSDKQPSRWVDELELIAEIKRRSYSDSLDATRLRRAQSLDFSEVFISLGARLLNESWGTGKPNLEISLSKSFYTYSPTAQDRPNPMALLKEVVPFISLYPDFQITTSAFWKFGRIDGFHIVPRLKISRFSSTGSGEGGFCVGAAFDASASGYGINAGFDWILQYNLPYRTFLTLGFVIKI